MHAPLNSQMDLGEMKSNISEPQNGSHGFSSEFKASPWALRAFGVAFHGDYLHALFLSSTV